MCQQEVNWARSFAERRGWGYGEGEEDGRRDVWWKDLFWDGRAERVYGRVGYEVENEARTCVEVAKGEDDSEVMGDEDEGRGKRA